MDIVESLVGYFKSGETKQERIGLEIEHFVMKNACPLSFDGGVANILAELSVGARSKFYENGNLIGADLGDYTLTLEPASQMEVSIRPFENTADIYDILQGFYKKAEPVLKKHQATLETIPTLSDELLAKCELIPKKRYEYMDSFFKTSGTMGKNMMQGSTSVQVSVDYKNEADFVRKFRMAYILSPVFAYLMSEDKSFRRVEIWDNVDSKRTRIPEDLFSESFGFKSYAKELLEVPAIFVGEDYTGEKTIGELSCRMPITEKLVEHFLSMVFPDVRLKKYIEIRIADSAGLEKAVEYADLARVIFYTDALSELERLFWGASTQSVKADKASLLKDPSKVKADSEKVIEVAEKYGYSRRYL